MIKKEGEIKVCCVVTYINQSINRSNKVIPSSTQTIKDFFGSSSWNKNVQLGRSSVYLPLVEPASSWCSIKQEALDLY